MSNSSIETECSINFELKLNQIGDGIGILFLRASALVCFSVSATLEGSIAFRFWNVFYPKLLMAKFVFLMVFLRWLIIVS